MYPDEEVYLSVLHLTVKAFKFHSKKTVTLTLTFFPVSPSPTLPFERFVVFTIITTVSQSVSVFVHLVF